LVAVVALMTTAATPPVETIELGSTKVSLGMAQQKVLELLSGLYKVDIKPSVGESQAVFAYTSAGAMPDILSFEDQKLTAVIRYWGADTEKEGLAFAGAFYGALAQMIKEGKQSCTIEATSKQVPQFEFKSARVVCGGKYVEMTVSTDADHSMAYVTEVLGNPK
jgi:hypothetical protein